MRILSIDGGGIRGVIPAVWLEKLQAQLDRPLNEVFDIVAGTSTGSILAAGIATGMAPTAILDLYLKRRHEAFPPRGQRLGSRLRRLFSAGLSAPKYDGCGLDAVLQDVLGAETTLSAARCQLLVTTYDVRRRVPLVFDSLNPDHADKLLWAVCRASSSAPTYFPAHKFRFRAIHPLVDGGVVANNPVVLAIGEGVRRTHASRTLLDEFLVASFGTGRCTREITIRQSQNWGAAQWGIPVIDVMFDGSAAINDWVARQLIRNGNYVRFQANLSRGTDSMDDTSESNLNNLISIAETYVARPAGGKKLRLLAEKLNERDHATN